MNDTATLELEAETDGTGVAERRVEIASRLLQSFADGADVPNSADFEALTDLLLDAVLDGQQGVVAVSADRLRTLIAQWHPRAEGEPTVWAAPLARADTLLGLADGAADRLASDDDVALLEGGSRAHQMLQLLRVGRSLSSGDVMRALGIAAAQVSRLGKDLTRRRLAVRTKVGREVYWEISPHGEDALEAVAERRKESWPAVERRKLSLAPTEPWSDSVVEAGSGDPLELDPATVQDLLANATHIEDRSRLLFALLLQYRRGAVSERLRMWASLHRFASGPVRFEVPSPGEATQRIEELTWQALRAVQDASAERRVWPAPPPRWDGWAIVKGRSERSGIVFFEAKTEPQELTRRPLRQSRNLDSDALAEIFERTRKDLGAGHTWQLWPKYSDPAARLAFLHELRKLGVAAWWMNVYFVDHDRNFSDKMPAARETWLDHIHRARIELDIGREHELTPYVVHEFFEVPTGESIATDVLL